MGLVRFAVSADIGDIKTSLEGKLTGSMQRLCADILSDCDKYVPYRTGYLSRSGHVSEISPRGDYGEVVWSAPYAAECYYAGREFSHRVHPLACAHWFEAAKGERIDEWVNDVKNTL